MMSISKKSLSTTKITLLSILYCTIVFCIFSCRTSPSVSVSETLPDLPFQLDSLTHYGRVKLKKWGKEEMKSTDSSQTIKYYRGGVLLQSKPKFQSSDTLYYPDVTGIPKEKLNTLTRKIPYKQSYRLISIPPEYRTCELDSNTSQTIEYCREILLMYPPANRETFTHYVLNPKYEKDYPDELPMKMKIYNHVYSDDVFVVSWEKWKEMYQDSSSYFVKEIPAGYYSSGCTQDFDTRCMTMRIQQALRNRGYDIPLSGEMDNVTKAAITRFGKENGLPIPHNGKGIITWFPELSEDD